MNGTAEADVLSPGGRAAPRTACAHCEGPVPGDFPRDQSEERPGPAFCCAGCEAAYQMVQGLGLAGYYRRRILDPDRPPLKPDADALAVDYERFVQDAEDGTARLSLMVDGLHCAACVWLIEAVLSRQPGTISARVNMTTRRLALSWRRDETTADRLAAAVTGLGYRLAPYDPAHIDSAERQRQKALLRAMAVAGFAAGNVMLLSISVWSGHFEGMGPATRDLFHWLSALIALPAIAYAGRPFFYSAASALRAGHVNMDVPVSLAVLLAAAMSLHQTIAGAPHAYFDSAVTLLFFLLVGRYLDRRARGQARSAAEHLLALTSRAATVIDANGRKRMSLPAEIAPGMAVLVAAGERAAVDGRIRTGETTVDTGFIDGESLPKPAGPGDRVFAGTLNLQAPITIAVTAVGEATLLGEITRVMEAAERQKGRYVGLADRVARLYTPVVHSLSLLTFLAWWGVLGAPWQQALLNAIAVLIITCPCALALAVPVVQVIASGRLFRRGILVKSGTALERLADADAVVFDKTGTLTEGRAELLDDGTIDEGALRETAALAAASTHPLSRALVRAAEARGLVVRVRSGVIDIPGQGLEIATPAGPARLGSRSFCGVGQAGTAPLPELWFARPGQEPICFRFSDPLRADAAEVVHSLKARGFTVSLLSGDRAEVVAEVARAVGIDDWWAAQTPRDKVRHLETMAAAGQRVMMVGDGLNDAPALAAAHASMSPSTAADISQTAADVVFQGSRLNPVSEALDVARRANRLVRQNLTLAFAYNGITIPLAVMGLVTPLIAAIAMSASSVVVIANALRLNRR